MTHKSSHNKSNSRARAKHIKYVRACNNMNTHSIKYPNAERSEDSGILSLHVCTVHIDVSPLKCSTKVRPLGRFADKKSAAGKQSAEVLQNAPIIERAFCRFSTEISACPCCHLNEEIDDEERDFYNSVGYTPCDVVSECADCRYFHV